ncbi:MAG: PD-(D/E)XK nuclease family protein [Euryarchaeota archaeon]|nr:PD-(D/E)XK nuclease family protein [Euryarchaeota archaeon]
MATYSHSRLATYENCPLKYRYQYLDRVQLEPTEGIEAYLGSRVHETLEKLYRDLNHHKENSLEDLLAHFRENWDKNWHDGIKIVRDEYAPENYRAIGERCISDYYNRYHPFQDARTVALEKRILIDLDGYRLQGYIDRLARAGDGRYEIHDYKSGQYLPEEKYIKKDRQLGLYQLGVESMYPDVEDVELVWHYLAHDVEFRDRRTPGELAALKASTVELIQEIERAEEEGRFPARESPLCSWCEFQGLCPCRAHLVKTGQMSLNRYLNDPGVKLVNEYARKKEEMKVLERELKDIEEALVEFARREGVEVIRGSDFKVRVRLDRRVSYPTKRDPQRAELDRLVKEAGLWMDVSDLNPWLLRDAVERGYWPEELAEKVRRFQKVEESYRFYLSRLKEGE